MVTMPCIIACVDVCLKVSNLRLSWRDVPPLQLNVHPGYHFGHGPSNVQLYNSRHICL